MSADGVSLQVAMRDLLMNDVCDGRCGPGAGPHADQFAAALRHAQLEVVTTPGGLLRVSGADTARAGHLAFTAGVELHELTGENADLERADGSLGGRLRPAERRRPAPLGWAP